jgi:hypothetical protein
MRSQIITVVIMVGLLAPTATTAALTQGQEYGVTLVCVPGDGASTALREFSVEQIANYVTQFGHEPTQAHPVTGICQDPAGLPIDEGHQGWTPGWTWICLSDPDGTSAGPVWLPTMNPGAVRVLPNPATGSCPEPRSPRFGQWALANPAAATAVHMTELEVAGNYQRLYAWMHPDSQAWPGRRCCVCG